MGSLGFFLVILSLCITGGWSIYIAAKGRYDQNERRNAAFIIIFGAGVALILMSLV